MNSWLVVGAVATSLVEWRPQSRPLHNYRVFRKSINESGAR